MTTVIIPDPHAVQDSEDGESPRLPHPHSTAGGGPIGSSHTNSFPANSLAANSFPAGCTSVGCTPDECTAGRPTPAGPVHPHPDASLVCRSFQPGDLPAVLAMLGRCSRETLFRRFHGATDGTFHALDLASRGDHQTLGAWIGSQCIGIASLISVAETSDPDTSDPDTSDPDRCYLDSRDRDSRDPDSPDPGHLGVLVEDGWQRRGVGSVLLNHLLDGARAGGISAIHAEVLAENRWVIRMLSQFGTIDAYQTMGVYSATVTLS